MKEIHYWRDFVARTEQHGIKYTVYSESVKLWNKRGVSLGAFRSTEELYFYMLGYESGLMDGGLNGNQSNS